MKKTTYFDKDEQELAESLEKENWISDLDTKEKSQYEKNALYSLNTQQQINITMSERDVMKIRAKAVEEGIPYQSFIENSRKTSPFRAGMDSVATASGLFVGPAWAKSWRWKSSRELTTTLPPVNYPQYKDNASSESFCLIPLLAIY